ncbi:MAG: phosphate signaling complex protein PhoU [Chitinispirillaceae bacterium]|nr:phosphate signaling complex protein PhoU [Chitinispirillaceae bacterium]
MIAHEQRLGIDISTDQLNMMAKLVVRAVENSLKALFETNVLLARNVIESDKPINSYEIDIDNSTFSLLTFSQLPGDILRQIIVVQKINAMLERIGDHAVNIAESAISLASMEKETEFFNLREMGDGCRRNLDLALKSFFTKDPELAKKVLDGDDEIDTFNKALTDEVKARVLADQLSFETALDLIRVSKNLERIADLSTNIAEEATFAAIGRIVKHHEE